IPCGELSIVEFDPEVFVPATTVNVSELCDVLSNSSNCLILINLDKTTIDLSTTQTTTGETTSLAMQTISQSSINNSTCFTPKITLIPGTSTLLSPIQFRRSEDFYIVSIIELSCQKSLSIISQWTIKTCNLNCSQQIEIDPEIKTTFTEISILAQTLPYGVYELTLTVTMRYSPTLKSSSSV
ncbi:unnamed protein product, partial [Adineta ricciae]